MKVSLDTNILIDEPEIVFDESREFVLSFTVIRELDNLKRNPDLKRSAQTAIVNIWEVYKVDKLEILNVPNLLGDSPDEKIIQDTKEAKASILSNDIAVRIIAKAHNVDISAYEYEDDSIDYDYTGYQYVEATVDYQKEFRQLKEMPTDEFEHFMKCETQLNEYVIVDDGSELPDIWKQVSVIDVDATNKVKHAMLQAGKIFETKHTVYVSKMVRISQKMGPFTAAGIRGVQPMDPVQMCVLDAVLSNDVPLTVIDGKLGTGKTMLSIMGALACTQGEKRHMHYDRILVTASPESINQKLYTGFKPGESSNKLGGHLGGFKSNLKFLLDPKKSKENRKNKREDEDELNPSDITWMNMFEILELDEAQGESLHNTIFMIDEWQKLSHDTLKVAISRISQGSKCILIGDTVSQVYGLNRSSEGFRTLYKHLGKSKHMSFIQMDNIYRSPLAGFVSDIFE